EKSKEFPQGAAKAVAAVRKAMPKVEIDDVAEPKGFFGSGGKGTPMFWLVRFQTGAKKQELSVTPEGVIMRLAAGLDFGEGHGPSFFRAMQELVYGSYLSNYNEPPIESFLELFQLFNDKHSYSSIGQLQDYDHASHLRAAFAYGASVSSMNATART